MTGRLVSTVRAADGAGRRCQRALHGHANDQGRRLGRIAVDRRRRGRARPKNVAPQLKNCVAQSDYCTWNDQGGRLGRIAVDRWGPGRARPEIVAPQLKNCVAQSEYCTWGVALAPVPAEIASAGTRRVSILILSYGRNTRRNTEYSTRNT